MAWNVFKKKSDELATRKKPVAKSAPTHSSVAPSAPIKPVDDTVAHGRKKKFSVPSTLFVRPLVTEKSLLLAGKHVYVFEVAPRATKIDVKKGFYNLYGVMPTGVRLMNMAGKEVRFGQRQGRRKDWKKAFITVPKESTVDIA